MSKIICDICGTTYAESADCCPICGCSRDSATDLLGGETLAEEVVEETKDGIVAPKKKEIFDFDEVNEPVDDEEDEEDEDEEDDDFEEEEEEEAPRHNTLLVILLTILIAGLLLVAGFIFVRYFLPNMGGEETVPPTTAVQVQQTTAATEPTVPCEQLTMKNAAVAELDMEGAMFLLNVVPSPENTTDKVIYLSGDESIATVSEDGKILAVSEGETTIYISCGKISNECKVVVKFAEETVPPTTEAPVVEETDPAGETVPEEETVPEDNAASGVVDPNVVLKLKKTDIMLGVYYQFTLQLDCGLEQNQVQWSSEHPHIAKVDENGTVTAVKEGTTVVSAKYGDQVVECWVRCY